MRLRRDCENLHRTQYLPIPDILAQGDSKKGLVIAAALDLFWFSRCKLQAWETSSPEKWSSGPLWKVELRYQCDCGSLRYQCLITDVIVGRSATNVVVGRSATNVIVSCSATNVIMCCCATNVIVVAPLPM